MEKYNTAAVLVFALLSVVALPQVFCNTVVFSRECDHYRANRMIALLVCTVVTCHVQLHAHLLHYPIIEVEFGDSDFNVVEGQIPQLTISYTADGPITVQECTGVEIVFVQGSGLSPLKMHV